MFSKYKNNTSGNVAMMFSFTVVILIMGIGAAIDYGSATSNRQDLQDMVDAATLAAAQANTTDETELSDIVDKSIAVHNNDNLNISIAVKVVDGQVRVSGQTTYNTRLMGMFGKSQLPISAIAASPIASATPVKVALVLDTTDSMTGSDMDALKSAANGFVSTIETSGANVAMSVVPFSQYVNVGTHRKGSNWLDTGIDGTSETSEHCFNRRRTISPRVCRETGRVTRRRHVRDGRDMGMREHRERHCTDAVTEETGERVCEMRTKNFKWHGCVGSRRAPDNLRVNFGAKRIDGIINTKCGSELLELTTTLSSVKSRIDDLKVSGETYLPSGVMWGWRTLDEDEPLKADTIPLSSNGTPLPVSKYMIFMTDGANTLSQGGSQPYLHNNNDASEADAKTLALCEAAKNDGIEIYTVGYRMAEATGNAKTILQACASSSAHYKDAANAERLKAVFSELAGNLGTPRLSM